MFHTWFKYRPGMLPLGYSEKGDGFDFWLWMMDGPSGIEVVKMTSFGDGKLKGAKDRIIIKNISCFF